MPEGVSFPEQQRNLEIPIKTAELVKPGNNPLLKPTERALISMLVRNAAFVPSTDPENVQTKGISEAAVQTLHGMVAYPDGAKKSYEAMVNEYNAKNEKRSSTLGDIELPAVDLDIIKRSPLPVIASSLKGDMGSVIERVSQGNGNCFEFALVMQLMAKVYYPEVIADAQILAISDNRSGLGERTNREFRHFHLLTTRSSPEGNHYMLTTYGGRNHPVTREQAAQKAEGFHVKGDLAAENLYRGVARLLDVAEK